MLLHGRVLGRLMTDVDSQTLVRHIGLSWSQQIRQTEEQVGRQHQGMDRPGVRQVPEGSGEQGKMENTNCKIICGAPTILAVKGLMMMMTAPKTLILDI